MFDLVIIDDIRDECPHDEIKEGKAEKTDDVDEDIDPDRACTQKKQQKTGNRTAKAPENADLALAEFFGQGGGKGGNDKSRKHTRKAHEGGAVLALEIIDEQILADGLSEKLGGENGDRGEDDADKRTAPRKNGESLFKVGILPD